MHALRPILTPLALAVACLVTDSSLAQTANDSDSAPFDRLTVLGTRSSDEIGGAANYVSTAELERFRHTDVHRALRQVPGLYVVEEDGLGLRPNIGLRGSGTDRNARITVMEDGVLIAPAPYAAPAAYYFPTMQRIGAVEVRKGSAAVRSGPRTTGGAINLVSTPIPDDAIVGRVGLQAAGNDTLLSHLAVGGTSGQWGYLLEGLKQSTDGFKEMDGGGDTGYTLDDLHAKLRYTTRPDARFQQEIELKFGVTDQDGDETYVGLTLDDFARTPYRRYAGSRLDNIQTDHDQLELRHYVSFGERADLTSVIYRSEFARNWYKVDRFSTASLGAVLEDPITYAAEYGWIAGANSPDNAIIMRNNNRAYQSRGVQTILGITPVGSGNVDHNIEIGLRVHEDYEDRLQDDDRYRRVNGNLVLTTDGARGTQDNRVGSADALSLYVHDELSFGKFVVTPGIRYESVDLEQRRWAGSDPDRVAPMTGVIRTDVDEVISGVGSVYRLTDTWTLLGGVHKGFNAPAPGAVAEAEESLNYEAGARYSRDGARAEVIAFYNDYDNLVGTCTASTGGGCDLGDQFSGGKVRMQGLELSAQYQFALARGLSVPLQLTYTHTSAEFRTSFASGFEEWATVEAGDELPYLPQHQAQVLLGLAAERWALNATASYSDAMRVVAGQGPTSPLDETDDYWVLDLAGEVSLREGLSLFARVENVIDDDYVVAWRPAGARPGRPRTALIGINANF
jgi:Fe(3+) dicitrate transport protein